MNNMICRCGSTTFEEEFAIDGFYVCNKCGTAVGYYCSGCDRTFTSNRLGLHGDVYECKICGRIQWGYTEWKRIKKIGERSQ